jgi:hypothetical protein
VASSFARPAVVRLSVGADICCLRDGRVAASSG